MKYVIDLWLLAALVFVIVAFVKGRKEDKCLCPNGHSAWDTKSIGFPENSCDRFDCYYGSYTNPFNWIEYEEEYDL